MAASLVCANTVRLTLTMAAHLSECNATVQLQYKPEIAVLSFKLLSYQLNHTCGCWVCVSIFLLFRGFEIQLDRV